MDRNIKFQFIVIGAGGTGSYFLKEFSRFLMAADKSNLLINDFYVIDGDLIEEKNTARQAFFKDDVGDNKAAVLCEALFDNFGIPWKAIGKYVFHENEIKELICYRSYEKVVPVIVGCCDNHGCRLLMERVFNSLQDCIYLDSANEFETGEVVMSFRVNGETIGAPRSYYFKDILNGDTRNRDEMSCTELNNVAPQHIVTNMLAGNILLSNACKIVQGGFKPGVVLFNSMEYSMSYLKAQKGE